MNSLKEVCYLKFIRSSFSSAEASYSRALTARLANKRAGTGKRETSKRGVY